MIVSLGHVVDFFFLYRFVYYVYLDMESQYLLLPLVHRRLILFALAVHDAYSLPRPRCLKRPSSVHDSDGHRHGSHLFVLAVPRPTITKKRPSYLGCACLTHRPAGSPRCRGGTRRRCGACLLQNATWCSRRGRGSFIPVVSRYAFALPSTPCVQLSCVRRRAGVLWWRPRTVDHIPVHHGSRGRYVARHTFHSADDSTLQQHAHGVSSTTASSTRPPHRCPWKKKKKKGMSVGVAADKGAYHVAFPARVHVRVMQDFGSQPFDAAYTRACACAMHMSYGGQDVNGEDGPTMRVPMGGLGGCCWSAWPGWRGCRSWLGRAGVPEPVPVPGSGPVPVVASVPPPGDPGAVAPADGALGAAPGAGGDGSAYSSASRSYPLLIHGPCGACAGAGAGATDRCSQPMWGMPAMAQVCMSMAQPAMPGS